MDFIEKMMAQAEEMQLASFRSAIEGKMDKKTYLAVFLETFLDKQNFKRFLPNARDMDGGDFARNCHRLIDAISLCPPEIDFFHQMVDLPQFNIGECIGLYRKIDGLDRCQLGPLIMKCLEASRDVQII